MPDLRDIYQELILEHARTPRNYRVLATPHQKAEGYNPLCGDRCTVYLSMQGDVIHDISFQGSGCAISRASASMMTQILKEKTVGEAEDLLQSFLRMITGQNSGNYSKIGKLTVFAGVSGFPARVRCATLAWHTLQAALHGENKPITTE